MDRAEEALLRLGNAADIAVGDPSPDDWEERNTLALIGIGHALLAINDAIREQTAEMKAQGRASQRAEPAW